MNMDPSLMGMGGVRNEDYSVLESMFGSLIHGKYKAPS